MREDVHDTGAARRLPFRSKLGFGVGELAEGTTLAVFNTFVLFFYNQILQVPGTLTGLALGIALFCDAVSDPLVGSISDRLKTRWGRRHPLMAGSAIPLGLSLIALFNPPAEMSEWFYFGWLTVWAVATRTFLTLYRIPHLALGAEMARDYLDRPRIFSYSQLFGTLGIQGLAFVMFTLYFPTTEAHSHGMLNADGYLPFSLTAAAIVAVAITLCVLGTAREIPYLPRAVFQHTEPFTPTRVAREIMVAFRNRSYRFLVGGLFCAVIMLGVEMGLMVFMYVHFWGMQTESMRWVGPMHLAALPLSVLLAPLLARRFERRHTLIGLSIVIIIANNTMICLRLFTDWLPPNGTPELLALLLSFVFISGLCSPAVMITLNSMFADVADEQELITGERQEGIIFSARSFSMKAGGATATILGGVALDLISFPRGVAAGEVSADAIFRLGLVAGPLTSLIGLLILMFYLGYRLDRARVEQIQVELAARRTAAAEKSI